MRHVGKTPVLLRYRSGKWSLVMKGNHACNGFFSPFYAYSFANQRNYRVVNEKSKIGQEIARSLPDAPPTFPVPQRMAYWNPQPYATKFFEGRKNYRG